MNCQVWWQTEDMASVFVSSLFDGFGCMFFLRCRGGVGRGVCFSLEPGSAKPGDLNLSLLCFFVDYFPDNTRCLVHRRFRLEIKCFKQGCFRRLGQWSISLGASYSHV